jgi:hypothetical protein
VNDLLAGFGVATSARAGGLEHTAPIVLVTELDVVVAAEDEVTD